MEADPYVSGRSTLARIIAKALTQRRPVIMSGLTSGIPGDFLGILTQQEENDVLIIEDAHSLSKRVQEHLCQPLKDFKLDVVIDSGPNARPVRLNLPHFTTICTTDRLESLVPAFLSSFSFVEKMEPYNVVELRLIALQIAGKMGLTLDEGVARNHVKRLGFATRYFESPKSIARSHAY